MKLLGLLPALLAVLPAVAARVEATAKVSRDALPSTFKPPQAFKNANLVHIISLEKNFVKESINLVIENVDAKPQDEYYIPFTGDQISHVGGLEVRDRKDAALGAFDVEVVEYDPSSVTQYYRITLPKPLEKGAQQTLSITYYTLSSYKALPASIAQDEQQYLSYAFSAYWPSAYPTLKQKTEVKFPTSNIPNYTKLPGSGDVKEFPQKQGSKFTYGPFDEKPAGATAPVDVRFEFNKPVLHVSHLERDVEVSHWGGNVAFEERYEMYHRGANLSNLFSRVKWQQAAFYHPNTYALKELRFPLKVGSADVYYYDVIGNISTSRFRSSKREALLEAKPRYPMFGGWKFPFTLGWNSDAKNFVKQLPSGSYIVNVPFIEGPKQQEGVEYEQVVLRVILPEGAENVKFYTTLPESSITDSSIDLHKTFLDTVGRTALTIKARNLVDDLRDRDLVVTYDVPFLAGLRKPIMVFASAVGVFAATYLLSLVKFEFASSKITSR